MEEPWQSPLPPPMTINVLILCTHNSARSVLAEGMLNHWAEQARARTCAHTAQAARRAAASIPSRWRRCSNAGVDATGYRSKSWDEFSCERTHRRCPS